MNIGFTSGEALLAATLHAAHLLGLSDRAGSIAPGALADLVVLGADPRSGIDAIDRIEGVVIRGRWLDRAAR